MQDTAAADTTRTMSKRLHLAATNGEDRDRPVDTGLSEG
jgi:hypothetical protein